MGMTDRQFDAYQQDLLQLLKRIEKEIAENGKSEDLEVLIQNMEKRLSRP